MKLGVIFALVVLGLFLVACSKTEVIKIGQNETTQTTPPTSSTLVQSANRTIVPAATTNTTGKTAVKCEDTDAEDFLSSGRVTVTYDDGSKKDYIDECPGKSNIVVEYVCKGNDVSTKLHICEEICVTGVCIE